MLQKIVLTPSLEGTDYLKSLANLNIDPKFTFGVRYFHSLEFARYLMQCNGIICPKEFVTNLYLSARMYHKVKEIEYFKNYSFEDVFELIKSVDELRKCIPSNEAIELKRLLEVQSFQRKNKAVVEFYNSLMDLLEKENLIDEIGLIRYAIEHSSPLPNIEFVRFEEFEYYNLDIALLNKAAGKEVAPTKLFNEEKPNITSYTKAFGQNSEIEDILAYIYTNNIKFDECVIAASDVATYEKILSNYQAVLKFPLIVNSGQSIRDTNAGRLFGSIYSWRASHYHFDYLNELLNSREFDLNLFKEDIGFNQEIEDKVNLDLVLSHYDVFDFDLIVKTAGNLKLGLDCEDKNNHRLLEYEKLISRKVKDNPDDEIVKRDEVVLTFVKRINETFNKGIINFLDRYLVADESNISIERNALEKYTNQLLLGEKNNIPFEESVRFLSNIAVGNRKPKEGSLFLTSITNAISFLRKHLFIVGLDSKAFPGKVSENPIVLDQDYLLYGIKDASSKKINENKKLYHDLVGAASNLGVDIHLSYSYYNSETVKGQNASSVFFETYKKENGDNKTVNDLNKEFDNKGQNKYCLTGLFQNDLFPLSIIGKKAKETTLIEYQPVVEAEPKEVDSKGLLSYRGLSATAIEKYVECQYEFFLNVLLHIEQEKDTNIYEIIPANEAGTITHELMEEFSPNLTKDEFIDIAVSKFNDYLIAHPSDNPQGEELLLKEFVEMASNGYDMELRENLPSVLKEEDVFATHVPTGLRVHGFPDKVVRLSDGSYRVVDYKTGNNIKHDVDKKESVLQGALYAYVLEHGKNKLNQYGKSQIKVSEFVFRYLKSNANISSFDKDHNIREYLSYLDDALSQIAESLRTGDFKKNGKCDSCYFKSVCGGRKS